ncbi:MAG: OmpH family outer membrane protein [Candidatus Hydrogenedentes bacterium]|nr:OmpH family outer membrane protein [Candidatus Hydrogenedentota bacterium]
MTSTLKHFMTLSICCALLAGLAAPGAFAQEGGNYKIGVVDMQEVLAKYEKRKSKYQDLQKQVDALQSGIDKMSDRIKAARDDYEKKKGQLSADQLLDLETKIRADYADYQSELTKSQQQIDSMEAKVLKEVVKDVQDAIEAVANTGNYHLVLNKEGGPRSAVLFASTTIDITSQVLQHLNK